MDMRGEDPMSSPVAVYNTILGKYVRRGMATGFDPLCGVEGELIKDVQPCWGWASETMYPGFFYFKPELK